MANQYFAGWKKPGYSYGAAVLMARCETGAAKGLGWQVRNRLVRL